MWKFLRKTDEAVVGAVGAILSILVTIIVGILIYYKVIVSMGGGLPADAVTSLAAVNTTAATVFQLAPIVAIIIIASIILGIVMGFGRGGGGQ